MYGFHLSRETSVSEKNRQSKVPVCFKIFDFRAGFSHHCLAFPSLCQCLPTLDQAWLTVILLSVLCVQTEKIAAEGQAEVSATALPLQWALALLL